MPTFFRASALSVLFLLAASSANAQITYGDVAGNPTNHHANHRCTGTAVGPSVRVFGDDVPPPHEAYAYFENEPTPPSGFYNNPTAYCFEVTYIATHLWMDGSFTQSWHDKVAQWYVGSGVAAYGPYPSIMHSDGSQQEGQSKGAATWNSTAYGGSCASGAAQLNSAQQCSPTTSYKWQSYGSTYTNGGSPSVLYTDNGSRSCFSECASGGYQGCTEQRRIDYFTSAETVTCIVNPSSSSTYSRTSQTTFQGGEPRYETTWNSYVYESVVQYQCSPPGQYSCVPAAAPTVSLSASPTTVNNGNGTTLYWSTTGATSCGTISSNLGHSIGTGGATSGAVGTPGLGQSVTFSLTCSGAGGSASASASVAVLSPPNLYSVTGGNISITAGQTATFTGATYNNGQSPANAGFYDLFVVYDTGYSFAYANGSTYYAYTDPLYSSAIGSGGGLSRAGYYTFNTPGTYYYRLCADWGGNVSESNDNDNCGGFATVTVVPPVPPNPTNLSHSCSADGTSATLSWSAAPGATDYYVRLYDYAAGTYAGYSDYYAGTSVSYGITPGRGYILWIYSHNSSGHPNQPAYYPSSSTTFSCPGLPDLTAGSVSISQTVPGRSTNFSAPVTNQGLGPSGAFPTLFQITDAGITTTIATVLTSISGNGYMSLVSGETGTARVTYSLPAGSYQVRACANYNQSWQAITTEGAPGYYGNNCGPWTPVTFQYTGSLSCTTSVDTAKVGDTVAYNAMPSNGAGSPYSWNDAQGGSYGSGSSVSRTFTAVGNYSMSVEGDNTIADSYACTSGGQPYITVGCAAPHVASLSANTTRVRPGGTATLTWSGAGINNSCVLSGPGVSQSIPANSCAVPNQTTQTPALSTQSHYCVTCDGTIQKCVTVNVIPQYEEF